MAKWKAGLAGLLILPLLMGAQSSCGSTTEKHKIRKQPVFIKCPKGMTPDGKGGCKKIKRPSHVSPTISCKKRLNGTLNCKKP